MGFRNFLRRLVGRPPRYRASRNKGKRAGVSGNSSAPRGPSFVARVQPPAVPRSCVPQPQSRSTRPPVMPVRFAKEPEVRRPVPTLGSSECLSGTVVERQRQPPRNRCPSGSMQVHGGRTWQGRSSDNPLPFQQVVLDINRTVPFDPPHDIRILPNGGMEPVDHIGSCHAEATNFKSKTKTREAERLRRQQQPVQLRTTMRETPQRNRGGFRR